MFLRFSLQDFIFAQEYYISWLQGMLCFRKVLCLFLQLAFFSLFCVFFDGVFCPMLCFAKSFLFFPAFFCAGLCVFFCKGLFFL